MGVHGHTQSRDRLFPQKKRIHLPQPMKKEIIRKNGLFSFLQNTEKEAAQRSGFFCHLSHFSRLAGISAAMRS